MSLVIFILLLAGLLWGGIFVFRGSLLVGCVGFLITTCCFGYYFLNFDLGPLPLTLDRLVLGGLIVAYVAQRRLGRADPKPLQAADWCLLAFSGLLLLSTLSTDYGKYVPGLMPPLMRLALGYLMPLAVYWIARQSALTERGLVAAYTGLAVFGLYLGVTAFLEVSQQWPLVFPQYISNPEIGLHFGRARGPMIQSVSLGLYLGICALCAWWLWPAVERRFQLCIVALLPFLALATYLTYTRSAWIGFALGGLAVPAFTLRGRARTAVLGAVALAGMLLIATKLDSLMGFQRELTVADTRKSVDMRGSFAFVSWQMFLDRPLLGFGFGQFYEQKLPYLSDRSTSLQLEEIRDWVHHNTLLSILTEVGIIGLTLFLGLLALWVWNAFQLCRNEPAPSWVRRQGILCLGTIGVYLCPLIFHELSYTPIDNSLVFFIAGITVGLSAQAKQQNRLAADSR